MAGLRAVGESAGIREPAPCVVDALEAALVLARTGEIVSIAMAVVYSDNMTGTQFSNNKKAQLLGALTHLSHRINDAWIDE